MPPDPSAEEIIVCPLTSWYFRRVALMAALFAGLGLYFLYDGAIGYPKTNHHADLFDAFEAGKKDESLDSLSTADTASGQLSELIAAHEAGAGDSSWAAFAAKRHLGEARPERHSPGSIRQQFVFAAALGVLALAAIVSLVWQRHRCLRAGSDWLEIPSGRRVDFSSLSGADFSKWDRGIAFLETREDGGGRNSRIRIDDYKFSGAVEILRRIGEARPDFDSETWQKITGRIGEKKAPD